MKRILLATCLLALFLMPRPAHAYKWYFTDIHPIHWEQFTVEFWSDADGLEEFEGDREYEIIDEVFAVWNALQSPIELVHLGQTEEAKVEFLVKEDQKTPPGPNENHIVFIKQGWIDKVSPGHDTDIALTTLSFRLSDGVLIDADIAFNDWMYDFTDCETAAGEELEKMDFFYVLLHELGHVFGLDHPSDGLAVMYPQHATCEDEPLHHLTPDDREGFLSYYGTEDFIDDATPPEPEPELETDVDAWTGEEDPELAPAADEDPEVTPTCAFTARPLAPLSGALLLLALLALALFAVRRPFRS